jgi:hypothetical protein
VEHTDLAAGTVRPSAAAAAPALTSLVPSGGPAAGGNSVALNGSSLTGATSVTFGANPAPTYTVNSASLITATAPPGSGTVTVTVRTPSGTSNGLPYTYAAVPVLTAVSPNQGPTAGGTVVTLAGTGLSGATAVTFGSNPAASFTVNSSTQITATTPAGTGAVAVTVTTAGGTSGPVFFYYVSAPALAAITPTLGPAAGGTTVTLTGGGLTGATAVTFGATPAASFTVNSSTQITATTPAGTGSVPVTVTTPGGTGNAVVYTYVPVPVLSALTPTQGPTDAGSGVTLTGSGLTTTTAVLFGAVPAAFTVLSDTTVAALAPAGPAGAVAVHVTSLGGSSGSLTYTRLAPPAI